MRKTNLIWVAAVASTGALFGGCANADLSVTGRALAQSWPIVRGYAERGLDDAVEDGELERGSAQIIAREFDEHGLLIEEMVTQDGKPEAP